MLIRLFTVLHLIFLIQAYNVCENNKNFCSNQNEVNNEECNIVNNLINFKECSTINFSINRIKLNLGNVKLHAVENNSVQLQISFDTVKWKKCYLKLSDYKDTEKYTCKMYSVASHMSSPLTTVIQDDCFWKDSKFSASSYNLEYKAENKLDIVTKKFVFTVPSTIHFGPNVNIENRSVFSYVDCTDNSILLLKIQPLPRNYNVSQYKVQVYRERDKKNDMVDIRMFSGNVYEEISFEYITYNEEGDYYFIISVINDKCPEDLCWKTVTPKIYISRKGTPLVIGIVAASFIIPFVLFIFHMINRRYKNNGELLLSNEKVVFIFKPSSDLHCDVINSLAKLIRELTGKDVILEAFKHSHENEKICSDEVLYATHVVYVPPPLYDTPNCEMDYMTYNFIKDELKKENNDKLVIVARLPYSTQEIPDILQSCPFFNLMDEFDVFLNLFEKLKKLTLQNNTYQDLLKKIDIAKNETETKNGLDMPKIVITEQSDGSDAEFEGLL